MRFVFFGDIFYKKTKTIYKKVVTKISEVAERRNSSYFSCRPDRVRSRPHCSE